MFAEKFERGPVLFLMGRFTARIQIPLTKMHRCLIDIYRHLGFF